jgi:drug/metabolite transporter (DMT)-like permease
MTNQSETGFSKIVCLYLLFTFFIWGSIYIAGKMIAGDIPPYLLACLRCVVGIFPLLYMSRKYWHMPIASGDWKWFILSGFLGYFITLQMVQLGIYLTGASVAALVNSLTPVAVTIFAAIILKEKITVVKCLCLALAIGGTVIISGGATGKNDIYGIIAALVAMSAFGFASVAMRRLTAKYPPILITMYSVAIGLLFNIPVGIYTALTQQVRITPLAIGALLYLGFVGTGLAQFTWAKCLSMLPASTCSLFYPFQAIFSALLGSVILGETFNSYFFVGLALISLDVVLNTWETQRLAKTPH